MSIDELIARALKEDIGDGDHTTLSCIPADAKGSARLLVKEDGILCGTEIAGKVFHKFDPGLLMDKFIPDGSVIRKGDIVFTISGRVSSILQTERLVLNFMQRMSGIATATNKLVRQVGSIPVRILDTRKTTPLLRELEKIAPEVADREEERWQGLQSILESYFDCLHSWGLGDPAEIQFRRSRDAAIQAGLRVVLVSIIIVPELLVVTVLVRMTPPVFQ